MDASGQASLFVAFRRGYFPHQLSWLLNNPLRRLFIHPAAFADRLPLQDESRVLEVGPGSGFFSAELARRVPNGRLELLDMQPEMLTKAIRNLGDPLPPNIGCTVADASKALPFEDDSFDLVLLVAVLGELPSPEEGLSSFFRILRPGGVLAVHEHLPDPDIIWPKKLRTMTAACGFCLLGRRGPAWNYTALFEKPRIR